MRLVIAALCLALAATFMAVSPASAGVRSRTTPVTVGERAPDFSLSSHLGGTVTLSKALENGPAVVVFYRGSWCPFCARQLAELRSLELGGATLVAISVDDASKSRDFAKKIAKDGRGDVGFSLLSDPGHATIDAYGLHDTAYDGGEFDGIPHAAVYVIGRDGLVAWAKVSDDYKVRPSNADIRAALGALAK